MVDEDVEEDVEEDVDEEAAGYVTIEEDVGETAG